MTPLFAFAMFVSAVLLFMLQPLAGKWLLPVLGGSPAVWSTCMLFFQFVLLLGYLYAHLLSTRVSRRWQGAVHVSLLIVASLLLTLPIQIGEPGRTDPRWWALGTLTRSVGLPFFALSATTPLLLRWLSRTTERQARDPYFLYAVSNGGSLLGLLGYLLLEPVATRTAQVRGWSVGFWLFAVLTAACAYITLRPATPPATKTRAKAPAPARVPPVRPSQRALWIALALIPSALLLGVTQHLATDVVSAPLLWVVPLALYLATFMAAFSKSRTGRAELWGAIVPLVVLLILVLSLAEVRHPIAAIALAHLAAFTVLAMLCHTRLAESRPDASQLTGYFVCVSLGGVLGSAAAALVAPVVFSSVLEYPLAIGAALLFRPQTVEADRLATPTVRRWLLRVAAAVLLVAAYWGVSSVNEGVNATTVAPGAMFGWVQSLTGDREMTTRVLRVLFVVPAGLLVIRRRAGLLFAGAAAGLLLAGGATSTGGEVLDRERTFFGVHQVTSVQNGDWHELTHGTTTHGVQGVRGKARLLPTAYYHPSGPLGDLVFALAPEGRLRDVAVVGLGAGAIAGYVGSGMHMDFFEVDETVIRIAENPRFFTYLTDARARPGTTVRTIAADGRIGLGLMPLSSYDLIVIDAFSSDAIPTHLLTREAVTLYESRLKARGVMAFHVSSRFFDLQPVIARIAEDVGLVCYGRDDRDVLPENAAEAKRASVWLVLAREANDLGQIPHSAPRWVPVRTGAGSRLWTDDYTNPLGALQH